MDSSKRELELLSRQISQAHRAAIQAELVRMGLGEVGHPMLLSILESSFSGDEEGRHAQRDLAQLLHISPAAVANSLKSLERGGYIYRRPRPGDARCNLVLLTEKGAAAVEGCHQAFARVSRRMMEGFDSQEIERLADFQQRVLNNLLDNEERIKKED